MRGAVAGALGIGRLSGGRIRGFEADFDSLSGERAVAIFDFAGAAGGQFFANGDNTKTFAGLFTFARASEALYRNSSGVYITAANGAHRLDHDVSGNRIGLLIEEVRENLCIWSDDLTNAAYDTGVSMTVAKDQTGADGAANSASSLLATAGNATHGQNITSSSATRVFSAHVKRLVGTGVIEMTQDGGSSYTAITSLINSSTYTQAGVAAAAVTNPNVGFRIVDSGDKIAVQYCFSEIGSKFTSPIPTTTVAVTRLVDDAPAATSGWDFSATVGSLYGVVTPNHLPASELILFSLNDGTANEVIEVYIDSSANVRFRVTDGGVDQCDIDSLVNAVAGTELKIAVSWAASDFAISVNGATIAVDTGGTLPTVTTLDPCENGTSASLTYYKATLSDADLVARTA